MSSKSSDRDRHVSDKHVSIGQIDRQTDTAARLVPYGGADVLCEPLEGGLE
jgi:hypothetical protein